MRRFTIPTVLALAFMAGCAARADKTTRTAMAAGTLGELRSVRPDVQEVKIEQGLEQAMQNFFVKGNLIALRELSLRRTAERVDAQVTEWKREHGVIRAWPTRERILVAVGPAVS